MVVCFHRSKTAYLINDFKYYPKYCILILWFLNSAFFRYFQTIITIFANCWKAQIFMFESSRSQEQFSEVADLNCSNWRFGHEGWSALLHNSSYGYQHVLDCSCHTSTPNGAPWYPVQLAAPSLPSDQFCGHIRCLWDAWCSKKCAATSSHAFHCLRSSKNENVHPHLFNCSYGLRSDYPKKTRSLPASSPAPPPPNPHWIPLVSAHSFSIASLFSII